MNRNSGLTVMELAVTLAVFAVLCALSVPQMVSWRGRARMNDAATKVLAAFQNARLLAVRENAPVWVSISTGTGGYEVFVDNGPGDHRANALRDADEKGQRGELPPGVSVARVTRRAVRFDGCGIPHFGTTVTLTDTGGRLKKVILSPSGHSRIES